MDNNKKKNNIEIKVLEIRNNAQFYLISAIIENTHYKVVTRYKSIEKFKSKIQTVSATFPGNSFLNPTFGDSSRTDARRASLQVWLKEVLQKNPTTIEDFLKRQPEEHGPLENSLHFHPSWFFVNSKPSPMYWESQGTIQKHNYNLKYWPKLTEHLQLVPLCSKVYGCRSLIGNELNSYSVGLYYLPWATYFKLGCLDIPKKPDSVSVNFRFCMDGKKIWMYVEYQILIFDLSDFSWKSATIPPTLQNYTYPLILVNTGKEIHVLGDRIHHAIDSTTFAIRVLPNITAEPSYNWCGVQARNYIFLCATSSCYVFNLSTETWETSLQLSKSVLPHVISAAYDNCNFVYVWGSKKAYRFDFRKKIWEDDIPDLVELQKIESGVSFVTHEFDYGNDLDDNFENLLLINYFRQDKSWQTLLTNNQITKEEHDLMSEFDNLSVDNIHDKFKIFLEHQKDYLMIYTKTQNPRIIYLNLLFLRLVPESEGLLDMKDHFREISKQDSSSTFHFKKIPGLIPPSSSPSPSPSRSSSPSPYSLSSPSSLSSSISISVSSPSPSPSSSVSSYSASPYLKTQTNRILNISSSSSPSPSSSPSFSSFAPKELTQEEINYRTTIIQIIKERNIEIPDYLYCPITHQLIFEPVFTTDGHTYEREAIQKWFLSGNKTSPLTNEPLSSFTLTPNHLVKKIINLFLEKHKLTEKEVKIEK